MATPTLDALFAAFRPAAEMREINPTVKALLDATPRAAFTARLATNEEVEEMGAMILEARQRAALEAE